METDEDSYGLTDEEGPRGAEVGIDTGYSERDSVAILKLRIVASMVGPATAGGTVT